MPTAFRTWGAYLIMGALNNALPFSLIVWGQTGIDSGVASILNATTPIFTVLIAHMLTSDEHLNLRKMIGVLTAFLGVYVMLVTFLVPISALLLGVGVLGEVIHVWEYAGMGCIFLGLILIDGRLPAKLNSRLGVSQP